MKVRYDRKTDTLSIVLRDNMKVFESDEDKPGVILDYDKDGNLITATCTCSSFASKKLAQGPCEHILGLRLAEAKRGG